MVHDYVLRFHVAMHYPSAVTKIQGPQQLEQVKSDLHIVHVGDQRPKINIVKMIKNLNIPIHTREIDLDAGSLTTSLS